MPCPPNTSWAGLVGNQIRLQLAGKAASEAIAYGTTQVKSFASGVSGAKQPLGGDAKLTDFETVTVIDHQDPIQLLKAENAALMDKIRRLEFEVEENAKWRKEIARKVKMAKDKLLGFRGWGIDAESRWELADLKELLDSMQVEE